MKIHYLTPDSIDALESSQAPRRGGAVMGKNERPAYLHAARYRYRRASTNLIPKLIFASRP